MAKPKILAAVELDAGTVSILGYDQTGNNDLAIIDLPTDTMVLFDKTTSKVVPVYLSIVNMNVDKAEYNQEHLARTLANKFDEMLRMEAVVKVYGELKWEPYNKNVADEDLNRRDYYGGGVPDAGQHYGQLYMMVDGLTKPIEDRAGFRRHRCNQVNTWPDGRATVEVNLPNGLAMVLSYPVNNQPRLGAMVGFVTGPDDQTWGWEISYSSYMSEGKIHLGTALDTDDVAVHVQRELKKAFPFLDWTVKNFIAVCGVEKKTKADTRDQF